MKIRAFIDARLGGLTGHVIPVKRDQVKDVPDEVARDALRNGIAELFESPAETPEESGKEAGATDGLAEVLRAMKDEGIPEADLKADGIPRTAAVKRAGGGEWSAAEITDAWTALKED